MIVLHRYRLIFLKTRKTAGTSIEAFLSLHAGPGDIVTPIHPPIDTHVPRNADGYYNHMPGYQVREKLSNCWDSYFRFCVERDPWDKTLSFYHMLNHRAGGSLSFEAYLDSGDFCVDRAIYTEPGDPDQLLVHRVLRYERLDAELAEIFAERGIPFTGDLGFRAKADYRSDRRPAAEVYTPAQAAVVAEAFQWEIKRFGYRFGGCA